jgi:hypothetical protein
VLLIPLQAGTVVRGLGNANLMQSRQLRQVNQKLAALREKIQLAPDLASLRRDYDLRRRAGTPGD